MRRLLRAFWNWLKGDPPGPDVPRDNHEEARMLGTHARDMGNTGAGSGP